MNIEVINPLFPASYAGCDSSKCVRRAIIRYPKIYGSLLNWRHAQFPEWSFGVDLVIPTLGQDRQKEAGLIHGRS